VRTAITAGDSARLRRTLTDAPHAARAHPSTEHFWPLLVAAGAAPAQRDWQVVDGGIAHGMLSMDAFVFAG
jgi:4,5-DOPA dioxygenase extradiol